MFYHPSELANEPLRIFMLWKGLSSFGGFFGAGIGAFAWRYYVMRPLEGKSWLRELSVPVRRATSITLLPFADVVASVFPVA